MSIRFTKHALQRLNERFPGRDEAWTLLREVERKLSSIVQTSKPSELELYVTVHFRPAKVVMAACDWNRYLLITVAWCD